MGDICKWGNAVKQESQQRTQGKLRSGLQDDKRDLCGWDAGMWNGSRKGPNAKDSGQGLVKISFILPSREDTRDFEGWYYNVLEMTIAQPLKLQMDKLGPIRGNNLLWLQC